MIALSSCASLPKELNFEEQYGKQLAIEINGVYLFEKYDRDNDNLEDLRLIYKIVGSDEKNIYLELIQRWDDENRNGVFEPKEITKLVVDQDQPISEKEAILKNLVKY